MFLVLIVHADYLSLGVPTQEECIASPANVIARDFFQSLSICCVDTFILISGWFGINPKLKSFANFIFQCLFFLCGINIILLLTGNTEFSFTTIKSSLALTSLNWFIKAYIVLYILSPILNAYIEKANEKELRNTLIYFFIFQSIYGCLTNAASFFASGYSPLSFIGLYLFARYIKIYKKNISNAKKEVYLSIFFAITVLHTALLYIPAVYGKRLDGIITAYTNPLVIIQSMALLLYFSRLKLKNKVINWIAASSFAVFLIHVHPNIIYKHFKTTVIKIYESTTGAECLLYIFAFLCAVFIAGIVIDKLRIFIWTKLWNMYERR